MVQWFTLWGETIGSMVQWFTIWGQAIGSMVQWFNGSLYGGKFIGSMVQWFNGLPPRVSKQPPCFETHFNYTLPA